MCLFVPSCSLLKSFRIQNWRRGWDPECKQSVHMAVIIGKIWVLLTRGPRNLVIMPIDLRICCGEWHRRWQKSECFSGCYWSRRLQVVEEFVRSRKSEYQDVYTVDAAFAETLRTCSHCYCWKTQVLDCVTRSESVSEFVVRLKKLASSCSFGEFLSQALRDRLVSELHSKSQRHFLSIYYNWRAPTKDLKVPLAGDAV